MREQSSEEPISTSGVRQPPSPPIWLDRHSVGRAALGHMHLGGNFPASVPTSISLMSACDPLKTLAVVGQSAAKRQPKLRGAATCRRDNATAEPSNTKCPVRP